MHHLAIMNKKERDWLQLIVDGEKSIEARWYKTKHNPWDKIQKGDTIYFKNSGEPVTAKANVERVLQIENLTKKIIEDVYEKYGEDIGRDPNEFEEAIQSNMDKKYCILIFLKNVRHIALFNINKKGFGSMSAWITIDNIRKIIA